MDCFFHGFRQIVAGSLDYDTRSRQCSCDWGLYLPFEFAESAQDYSCDGYSGWGSQLGLFFTVIYFTDFSSLPFQYLVLNAANLALLNIDFWPLCKDFRHSNFECALDNFDWLSLRWDASPSSHIIRLHFDCGWVRACDRNEVNSLWLHLCREVAETIYGYDSDK